MDEVGWHSGLTKKDKEYCTEELNENEWTKSSELSYLTNYLLENPKICAKTDVPNLLRFLRATKFNREIYMRKLINFYKLRGVASEWFNDRDPNRKEIQELLDTGVFLPLMKPDPDGCCVIIIRIAAHDPKLHKQNDVFKTSLMVLDLLLDRYEVITVYGVKVIFDMNGVELGHALQLTLPMIRQAVHSWQDCYPVRVKGLNFVNSPSYIDIVLRIFRRFMNEKIRQRVHIHGSDYDSLYKFIHKDILPREYGGSEGDIPQLSSYWREQVTESADWYCEDDKYKTPPDSVSNE